MSKSVLNNLWMDRANVPLLDGVFDDSLSDIELQELQDLLHNSEGYSDFDYGC